MKRCCDYDINILVCVLTIFFGMGSWIAVNGVFIELPILVSRLPEGWSLPSYLVVVVQIANIGPLVYTVWNVVTHSNKNYDKQLTILMVVTASVASLLLAFFWTETSVIGGQEHSTALLVLTFLLSLVSCLSSVVFLPFMNTLKSVYMTPFFVGMGFSGLVPSLIALGQGAGQVECRVTTSFNMTMNSTIDEMETVHQAPAFPVKYFFLFIFFTILICGIAFLLLNYLPHCKSEHVSTVEKITKEPDEMNSNSAEENAEFRKFDNEREKEDHPQRLSRFTYLSYLLQQGWINVLLNGVLLSVQSYACFPYGIQYYHLSVTLSNIADPFAGFITFFLNIKSPGLVSLVTFVGTSVTTYIVFVAADSPTPVLIGSIAGGILVVSAYVLAYFTLTLSKVSIAAAFRQEGRRALVWCGAATQLGSAVGSVIMFVLVNVLQIFQQVNQCS